MTFFKPHFLKSDRFHGSRRFLPKVPINDRSLKNERTPNNDRPSQNLTTKKKKR